MTVNPLHVGIVGLGGNTRTRHVPGLLRCSNVQVVAVCNRRPESTAAAAREFQIKKTFERWQDLVVDPEIDAVVVGTWPYLHSAVTTAALDAGKHVLCEARMAMNVAEAEQMLAASRRNSQLVGQLVPSPLGLGLHRTVKRLITTGFLGRLREVVAISTNDSLADSATPLHWRQVRELSGVNMLTLGIVHETLIRWVAEPVRVLSQVAAFTAQRFDSATGTRLNVGSPDSVQVLATLADGASAVYHVSGVTRFGPGAQIHLYGSEGTLKIELTPKERILGGRVGESELKEIPVPTDEAGGWNVEADFVASIRDGRPVEFTNFADGLHYMTFTEAVARSAASGSAVVLLTSAATATT